MQYVMSTYIMANNIHKNCPCILKTLKQHMYTLY